MRADRQTAVRLQQFALQGHQPQTRQTGGQCPGRVEVADDARATQQLSRDVSHFLRRRLSLRRGGEPEFARAAGAALPRALADRIMPGSTTEAEVVGLCGRPDEEHHRRGPCARRTLVYRAARRLPSRRLALGPLATVRHWEDEYHDLEVELDQPEKTR